MRKADAQHFEALASSDESVRVAAATALDALPKDHFAAHPIGKFSYAYPQTLELVRAWHATGSDLVRRWIAQALLLVQNQQAEIEEIMLASVPLARQWQPGLIQYVGYRAHRMPGAKELVKSLHRDPDPDVRAACAQALDSMRCNQYLDYASDVAVLRRLLVDTNPSARQAAVRAVQDFDLGREDCEVLLDLVNMDSGSARHYARELLAKIAARQPDCALDSFAPRSPLLRTDGMYVTRTAEVTASGRWVTTACLRFFPDGRLHGFGTSDVPKELSAIPPELATGTVHQEGCRIAFSLSSAQGAVDYQGTINGDQLELERTALGAKPSKATYSYIPLDWDRLPAQAAAPQPPRKGNHAGLLAAFEIPRPRSLIVSDAAKWYLQLVARLPGLLDSAADEGTRLAQAWEFKHQARDAAVKALYDRTLKSEFLQKLPVPALDELLQASGGVPAEALRRLLDIPLAERRAFPGTIGESIGMTYWDGKNTHVMTEEGWKLEGAEG